MGYASELLKEFNSRLSILEARVTGLERTLATLDGLQTVFSNDTAHVRGDNDKIARLITAYADAKEQALIEVDNLNAAYKDVVKIIDRLPNRYRAVLYQRYIAGLSQTEIAKKKGITRQAVAATEAEAIALLDIRYGS